MNTLKRQRMASLRNFPSSQHIHYLCHSHIHTLSLCHTQLPAHICIIVVCDTSCNAHLFSVILFFQNVLFEFFDWSMHFIIFIFLILKFNSLSSEV